MSSNPVWINNRLSFDGVFARIQNNTDFNGQVIINLYTDRFCNNKIGSSQPLLIREKNHTFNLFEIFSSVDFQLEEENGTTICFQVVSEKQNLPLALYCVDIVQGGKAEKPREAKSKLDFLSGNINYELEAFPLNNQLPPNHILDFNGELNAKNIPIQFQGFFQRNKDPYLDADLSHFTVYFDVNQWKTTTKNKAEKAYQKERDSLLADFPAYESSKQRLDYIKRVQAHPNTVAELASIENLDSLMRLAEVTSRDELDQQMDSLEIKQKELNAKLIPGEHRDSLQQKLDSLNSRKEHLEKLAALYSKKEAYGNMESIKREGLKYLEQTDSLTAGLDQKYNEALSKSNKLNQYLREQNIGKPYEYLLNHISAFRYGNIHPGYSQLALQNNQVKGLRLGLEYDSWSLDAFSGRLQANDLNLQPDSLEQTIKIIGARIGLGNPAKMKNNIFVISATPVNLFGISSTQNLFGYTTNYRIKNQELSTELVWSKTTPNQTGDFESNDNAEAIYRSLAALVSYSGQSKTNKIQWDASAEYYGPDYFDINNPFLVNNSIELNGNIHFPIGKHLRMGANTLFNEANVWEEQTGKRQTIAKGVMASFFHEKWPAVQYIFNTSKIKGEAFNLNSQFHNLSMNKAYKVNQVQLQSFLNITYVDNHSAVDSVNNNVWSAYISQEVLMSKKVRMVNSFNYSKVENIQNGQILNLNYTLKLPITLGRLNIDPGMKWVQTETLNQWGWNVSCSWAITENLNWNAMADSLWLNSNIDKSGNIQNDYTTYFRTSLNYRF